jgi:hypothetical protein
VSVGEKDVCRVVMEEAGDWRLRSFERSFRRNLCGTKNLIVRHGKEMFDFEKTLCGCSVHRNTELSIAACSLLRDRNSPDFQHLSGGFGFRYAKGRKRGGRRATETATDRRGEEEERRRGGWNDRMEDSDQAGVRMS